MSESMKGYKVIPKAVGFPTNHSWSHRAQMPKTWHGGEPSQEWLLINDPPKRPLKTQNSIQSTAGT